MIRWLQIAWVGFWSTVLLGMLAVTIWAYWPSRYEPHRSVFTMPLTQLACLRYAPAEGETMAEWDFEQPIVIDIYASSDRTVNFSGGIYRGCPFSAVINLHGLQQ